MNGVAQARLEAAVPAALRRLRDTPGVYAAVWCGSASRGEADDYSDLDFHVLVTGDDRWRSNFVVDGVPVEVFHNPARKVRAMVAAGESDTITMYAQGVPVLPHPELEALQDQARRVHATGRVAAAPSDLTRFMLVDTVMDARAAVGTPVHVLTVMAALGPLVVEPLYAARGWWDVKCGRWLTDLEERDEGIARDLRATLTASDDLARQAAFEALAVRVAGDLAYHDGQTDPQPVP